MLPTARASRAVPPVRTPWSLFDGGGAKQAALMVRGRRVVVEGQALGRVNDTLSQPFDYGSVQDLSDQSYAAQTARLDPEWQARDQ